jgi:hypothetical protein
VPKTAKLMGTPKKTTFGSRVKRTTTNSGTKKIRRIVKLFGRFIQHPGGPVPDGVQPFTRQSHYRPRLPVRQRPKDPAGPQNANEFGVTKKQQSCPKPVQIKSSDSRDLRTRPNLQRIGKLPTTSLFSASYGILGVLFHAKNDCGRKIAIYPENHFHTISTVGIPMISMRIRRLSGEQYRRTATLGSDRAEFGPARK